MCPKTVLILILSRSDLIRGAGGKCPKMLCGHMDDTSPSLDASRRTWRAIIIVGFVMRTFSKRYFEKSLLTANLLSPSLP